MAEAMLSTIDNPYNPHTNFDEWYSYDLIKGYDCLGYLARCAATSDSLSPKENDEEIDIAIQSIIDNDPIGIYIKVYPSSKIKPIPITAVMGEGV